MNEKIFCSADQPRHTRCANRCVEYITPLNGRPRATAYRRQISQQTDQPTANATPSGPYRQTVGDGGVCDAEFSKRSCRNEGEAEAKTGGEPIREMPSAARDSTRNSVESGRRSANPWSGIRRQVRSSSKRILKRSLPAPQKRPGTRHTNLRRATDGRESNQSADHQQLWRFSHSDDSNATTGSTSTSLRLRPGRNWWQRDHGRAHADTQGAAPASPAAEKAAATQESRRRPFGF